MSRPHHAFAQSSAGGLAGVVLDPGVSLYLSGGVDLLFTRMSEETGDRFLNSWIHLPAETIDETRIRLGWVTGNPSPTGLCREPLVADEQQLFLIFLHGRAMAVASAPRGMEWHISTETETRLIDSLRQDEPRSEQVLAPILMEFLARLYQRDSSLEQFNNRLMAWLSEIWPRSFAGAYVDLMGQMVLRQSAGSVEHCYRLRPELADEIAHRVQNALCKGKPFITADPLPKNPLFLDRPPDLIFVHAGIQSDRVQQTLMVAGPGDIDRSTAVQLQGIAGLVTTMHENQFVPAGDILREYSKLQTAEFSEEECDELLTGMVRKLRQHLDITRILISRTGSTAEVFRTRSAHCRNNGVFEARSADQHSIPGPIHDALLAGRPYLLADISASPLNDDQRKEHYLDNVKAELFLPLRTEHGATDYVAFGSSTTGNYLAQVEPGLRGAADFLALYLNLAHRLNDFEGSTMSAADDTGMARLANRLSVIRKLSAGCLHDISSSLSVVIGQIELLNLKTANQPEPVGHAEVFERVEQASETVSSQIEALRHIVSCAEPSAEGELDAALFTQYLPSLYSGFVRRVRDMKNVLVSFAAPEQPPQGLRLSAAAVYDLLLPALTMVIEDADRSGTLTVRTERSAGAATVRIRFPHSMIGYASMVDRLRPIYTGMTCQIFDELTAEIGDSSATLTIGPIDREWYELRLDSRAQQSPRQPLPALRMPDQNYSKR